LSGKSLSKRMHLVFSNKHSDVVLGKGNELFFRALPIAINLLKLLGKSREVV